MLLQGTPPAQAALFNAASLRPAPAPTGRRRLGLEEEGGGSGAPSTLPAGFAFGCGEGWDRLGVYFVTGAGQLYSLCPVVPWGERGALRASKQQGLCAATYVARAGELAHCWRLCCFHHAQLVTPFFCARGEPAC